MLNSSVSFKAPVIKRFTTEDKIDHRLLLRAKNYASE